METNYSDLLKKISVMIEKIDKFENDAKELLLVLDKRLVNNKDIFENQIKSFNKIHEQIDKYSLDFRESFVGIVDEIESKFLEEMDNSIQKKIMNLLETVNPLAESITTINFTVEKLVKNYNLTKQLVSETNIKTDEVFENFLNSFEANFKKTKEILDANPSEMITKANLKEEIREVLSEFQQNKIDASQKNEGFPISNEDTTFAEDLDFQLFMEKSKSRILVYMLKISNQLKENKKINKLNDIYSDFTSKLELCETKQCVNDLYIETIEILDILKSKEQ